MRSLILATALFSLSATAIELKGGSVQLSEGDRQRLSRCAAEGGCAALTRAEFEAYMLLAHQAGLAQGDQVCRKSL